MRVAQHTLKLIALIAVAFNLRLVMSCVGPIVDYLRSDLQMSRAQLGLLSTLPVLCMGIFAPVAQKISAARGNDTAILAATVTIAAAASTRLFADTNLMIVSALAGGIGIAIAGTLLNTFVKQHFADRAVSISGMYSASLCVGAALAAGATAPLVEALGSWRYALAIWSIPGWIAAFVWWRMSADTEARHTPRTGELAPRAAARLPLSDGRGWLITVFFGLQSITFYVVLAWLAPRYIELGWAPSRAGLLLSYWIASQVVFILLISRWASRSPDRRPWLAACGAAAALAMAGFAFAPLQFTWLWIALLGFANGGWFPLAMTLPLDYSRTPSEAGSWTAMMLCGGYLISALSPTLAGYARDHGASFSAIFACMSVLSVVLAVMSIYLRPPTTHERPS